MKTQSALNEIHKAIDRIRLRQLDSFPGTPEVRCGRYVEDFGILKLIAQEAKPFCVQAKAEHAALVAVAEAAAELIKRLECVTSHTESVMTFSKSSTFPQDLRESLA